MARLLSTVKAALVPPILQASFSYLRAELNGISGPRRFDKVWVVSPDRKRNGIARGAQMQVDALRRQGIEAGLLDATDSLRNPFSRVDHDPGTAYIVHCGGPQTASLLLGVLPHCKHAYRIAYWAWELSMPPEWPKPNGIVSEVWTTSEFSRASLARCLDLPIAVVPHSIPTQRGTRIRTLAQARKPFTVLTMADSRSSFTRKNVVGAIKAFKSAFGDDETVELHVKLTGPEAFSEISSQSVRGTNIKIISEYISTPEMEKLFDGADVLLSLHRAEGFGLPMLEAMSRGIPTIATNWSGNVDYMNEQNSLLVPFDLISIKDPSVYRAYQAGHWAEPNIDVAADHLRRLRGDADLYERLSHEGIKTALNGCTSWSVPL